MTLKRTKGELVFDIILYAFMAILIFVFIYPVWYVIVMSFNDATDAVRGGIYFWPRKFTLQNYQSVINSNNIVQGYIVTITRTVLGTIGTVVCTGTFAYAMSKKKLMFRNFYFNLCIVTMFFSGGLIPSVVINTRLGFSENFLVYIIPGLYGIMNMFIMKTFFQSLPVSLEEAAYIDGANDFQVFFRVVIPSSMPVISFVSLMSAIGQWNSWMDARIYITRTRDLWPIQYILQRVILSDQGASEMMRYSSVAESVARMVTPYSMQLALLVLSIGPIVFIYPFFQKYFIKGYMLGAVKE